MKKIRLGIIGTGSITQTAHLPIAKRMSDFDVACVCDVEKGTLRSISERYAVPNTTTDYREMLADEHIDAVIIATPTDTHHPICVAALKAGKHVLVERPMAHRHKESQEIAKLAASSDRVVMVGMNHRFRQDITTLKNLIRHGELGQIFMVEAGWLNYQSSTKGWIRKKDRAGGGVMFDLGIVMIDLILWLLDYPSASSVSATMYYHTTKSVEDSAICYFRLDNDVAVNLVVSWTATMEKQQYYLRLIGSKGTASVNPLVIHKLIAGSPVNVTPVLPDMGVNVFRRSYEHEFRHFIGAIKKHHPVISTAEEAVIRMKLLDAAYKSSDRKREVAIK